MRSALRKKRSPHANLFCHHIDQSDSNIEVYPETCKKKHAALPSGLVMDVRCWQSSWHAQTMYTSRGSIYPVHNLIVTAQEVSGRSSRADGRPASLPLSMLRLLRKGEGRAAFSAKRLRPLSRTSSYVRKGSARPEQVSLRARTSEAGCTKIEYIAHCATTSKEDSWLKGSQPAEQDNIRLQQMHMHCSIWGQDVFAHLCLCQWMRAAPSRCSEALVCPRLRT